MKIFGKLFENGHFIIIQKFALWASYIKERSKSSLDKAGMANPNWSLGHIWKKYTKFCHFVPHFEKN
jgi:hypothetical protein